MTERPWENEPNSLDFEAEGLPCVMRRHTRWLTWCGYVGVPQGHPLYGLPPNHPLKLPRWWFKGRRGLEGASPLDVFTHILSGATSPEDNCPISLAFQVHGGINFADGSVVDHADDDFWWFGFDCGHAGDYAPHAEDVRKQMGEMVDSMPEEVRAIMRELVFREAGIYRDQQYVVSECQSLAAQLTAIVGVMETETANACSNNRCGRA